MTKHIIAGVTALALVASVATPAKAFFSWTENVALVESSTISIAHSGANTQDILANQEGAWFNGGISLAGDNLLTTGGATATAFSVNAVNVSLGGCNFCGVFNSAAVGTQTSSGAFTGENTQLIDAEQGWAGFSTGVSVDGLNNTATGAVDSSAESWQVVNSDLSGWFDFGLDD